MVERPWNLKKGKDTKIFGTKPSSRYIGGFLQFKPPKRPRADTNGS